MSSPRRYVEPPPRVRVLDFAASSEDRFSPPKASIYFSPDGKRVFGVQDRPAVRVLRYEADAASATASANAQERQAAQPAGRRHAAFYQYIDAVRRNEQRWGLDAMQTRATARSSAAVYKARLGGSQGVADCLVWHPDLDLAAAGAEEEEEGGQEAWERGGQSTPRRRRRAVAADAGARPSTAPAAASRSPTSLDMWSQSPYEATSPRFKSRAAFEQRRCATPDMDSIKRYSYLQLHKQRRTAAAAREAREAELISTWPHGLPRTELCRAQAAGLRVVGLGIGGNPLSMPRRQYKALRPGMKWY